MSKIEIYTKDYCPFCARAKALLTAKGVPFTEIDVTCDVPLQQEMHKRSGRHTVPQIFLDGCPIGGSDDLVRLNENGDLDRLLGVPTSMRGTISSRSASRSLAI